MNGLRLSKFWDNNDTIASVAFKKTKSALFCILDPDFYSLEFVDFFTDYYQKYKNYFYLGVFTIGVPITIFGFAMIRKRGNIKQNFILQ